MNQILDTGDLELLQNFQMDSDNELPNNCTTALDNAFRSTDVESNSLIKIELQLKVGN